MEGWRDARTEGQRDERTEGWMAGVTKAEG